MKTPQSSEQPPLPLSDQEADRQERVIKAFANAHRLQILSLLKQHGGTMSVAEIVERFPLAQSTISHNLTVLRGAGLVDCRKEGPKVYYFIEAGKLTEVYMGIRDLVPGTKQEKKQDKRSA